MRHIYGLKYQNYDVNEYIVEIKSHHVPLGLNGHAGSNKVSPFRFVLYCVLIPSSCSYLLA